MPARALAAVRIDIDDNGVAWFTHHGKRFLTKGVNHINDGGIDDGVGGRDSSICKHRTGSDLCGDVLSFSEVTHCLNPNLNDPLSRLNRTNPDPNLAQVLGYAPYFESTEQRYRSREGWANSTATRLKQWGFNTVGGWSSATAEQAGLAHGLYYTHLLALGTTWLEHKLEHDLWSLDYLDQTAKIVQVYHTHH